MTGTALPCALASLLGVLGWQSAATMCALPLLALLWSAARGRRAAAAVVFCYYLAGAWVLPGSWADYVGGPGAAAAGVALWIASASLLALPWALLWPPRCTGAARIGMSLLLALLVVSVPPLGTFGWLNPLLAAASLFPGAGWSGLAATLLLMIGLAASVRWWPWQVPRRRAIAGLAALLLAVTVPAAQSTPAGSAAVTAPAGWRAVDTTLGRTPEDDAATIARQVALIDIVRQAIDATPAGDTPLSVLILPEQVAGHWTDAMQAVWQRLAAPSSASDMWPAIVFGASVDSAQAGRLRNAVLVDPLGAQVVSSSRQPVPLAMWRPWSAGGYDTSWTTTGVSLLGSERVLWSICYEDFLVWPFLLSFAVDRPTVVVSMANSGWAVGRRQQELQALHVHAWGWLFDVPVLRAVNRPAAR